MKEYVRIPKGLEIDAKVRVITSELDPRDVPGIAAPIGSMLMHTNLIDDVGHVLIKIGVTDIEWALIGTSGINSDNVQPTFMMNFTRDSNSATNVWLSHTGTSSTSTVPSIVPWKLRLLGITYSNGSAASDIDVEIYRAPEGTSVVPNDLMVLLPIRNTRVLRKTDFKAQDIIFDPGDKIAIYFNKVNGGGAPSYPNLDLHFEVIEYDEVDVAFSYIGDF